MKENKKAILDILKKKSKKDGKFENLVLNLALQKIDSDSFEFDGDAVYTNDKKRLVYCMSQALLVVGVNCIAIEIKIVAVNLLQSEIEHQVLKFTVFLGALLKNLQDCFLIFLHPVLIN